MDAGSGIEPLLEVLQTSASPLDQPAKTTNVDKRDHCGQRGQLGVTMILVSIEQETASVGDTEAVSLCFGDLLPLLVCEWIRHSGRGRDDPQTARPLDPADGDGDGPGRRRRASRSTGSAEPVGSCSSEPGELHRVDPATAIRATEPEPLFDEQGETGGSLPVQSFA